ncbi:IS630 family transposase [Myxococcus sp. 1LA]
MKRKCPDSPLRLSRTKQKKLLRLSRKAPDVSTALRFLAVAKVGRGLSRREVARQLCCAPSTVVSAVQRYRLHGEQGLWDRRTQNGTSKVDEDFKQALSEVLIGTPLECGWQRPTWSRELLCLEMGRRGVPEVSVATMGRALRAVGARLKRPKPVVLCPWPRMKRQRRIFQLRRLAATCCAREPVFYVDEVDIHLNPKVGPDWMLKGRRRTVLTPGNNEKRYLAGAMNAKTRKMTWVQGSSKASSLFISLLWRLATENKRARRIHLILDNASIHDSRKTRQALAQLGGRVVLHFLPPYCPEENRSERRWLDLHANVTRNHRCTSMDELMDNVDAYLEARNDSNEGSPALRRTARSAA